MQQGSIPWGGTILGVGQRLATCLGSRPTQVRILSPRPMRLSSSGRIGRRHRPDTGSNPVSLSIPSASKAHVDEQPAFNRWAASSRLAGGTNHCGSSGGPWAHNPKVEAGFNSLTRNQSPWVQFKASSPGNQAPPKPQYAIRYRGHSQKVVFLSVRLGPGVPIARPIRFPSVWGSGGIVRDTTSRPRSGHVKTLVS